MEFWEGGRKYMCVCVLESIAKGLVQKCDNGNRTGLIFLNSKSQINIMGKKIKKNACVCLVESLCCPAGINIVNQLGINKSKRWSHHGACGQCPEGLQGHDLEYPVGRMFKLHSPGEASASLKTVVPYCTQWWRLISFENEFGDLHLLDQSGSEDLGLFLIHLDLLLSFKGKALKVQSRGPNDLLLHSAWFTEPWASPTLQQGSRSFHLHPAPLETSSPCH